jgi:hypothetical protein
MIPTTFVFASLTNVRAFEHWTKRIHGTAVLFQLAPAEDMVEDVPREVAEGAGTARVVSLKVLRIFEVRKDRGVTAHARINEIAWTRYSPFLWVMLQNVETVMTILRTLVKLSEAEVAEFTQRLLAGELVVVRDGKIIMETP